jgi:methyl-accepting chemotaxis protein
LVFQKNAVYKQGEVTSQTVNNSIYTIAIVLIGSVIFAFVFGKFFVSGITSPIKEIQQAIVQIEHNGNFQVELNTNRSDEIGNLAISFEKMLSVFRKMLGEVTMLTQAAVQGKLDTRADASSFQGDFRKIVEGVNSTLDAVIGPLNVAADYVDKISRGAISAGDNR